MSRHHEAYSIVLAKELSQCLMLQTENSFEMISLLSCSKCAPYWTKHMKFVCNMCMAAALTHCRTELNCLQIDVLIHYTPTENLLLYAGEHACEKAGNIS